MPTHAIHDAVRTNAVLDPTTHKCVRYLAQHKQYPSIPKQFKRGWEAANRYFWGYMPPAKFTKYSVPDAKAGNLLPKRQSRLHKIYPALSSFSCIKPSALMSLSTLLEGKNWKSKSDQEFVGLCEDSALAEKDGPIHAARLFCGCAACTLLKFEECTMTEFVGKKLRQTTHLADPASSKIPQTLALEDWADELKPEMIVAVNVAADQRSEDEGGYWLAKLRTGAYALPHNMLCCGEEFEEGWIVAEAQWYKLEKPEVRGYTLMPEKVTILVNAMVRLSSLKFAHSRSGPQNRTLRSGGMEFLGDDEHYAILGSMQVV